MRRDWATNAFTFTFCLQDQVWARPCCQSSEACSPSALVWRNQEPLPNSLSSSTAAHSPDLIGFCPGLLSVPVKAKRKTRGWGALCSKCTFQAEGNSRSYWLNDRLDLALTSVPTVAFLHQDLVHDTTLYSVLTSPFISTDLWPFSQSFLKFHDLKSFEECWTVLCRMSLTLDLSDIFSWLDWGLRFAERFLQRWSVLKTSCQSFHGISMTFGKC